MASDRTPIISLASCLVLRSFFGRSLIQNARIKEVTEGRRPEGCGEGASPPTIPASSWRPRDAPTLGPQCSLWHRSKQPSRETRVQDREPPRQRGKSVSPRPSGRPRSQSTSPRRGPQLSRPRCWPAQRRSWAPDPLRVFRSWMPLVREEWVREDRTLAENGTLKRSASTSR